MTETTEADATPAAPSYHDLYIYLEAELQVRGLWRQGAGLVAGEYGEHGLRLDVNGVVICDSLTERT